MTQRTNTNLNVAMHAEAFASAKYKRYAAFSRSHDHDSFAVLLTSLADDSRIGNFADELTLSGTIGDDYANLRDVLRDLEYQVERYRQFAVEADQDGDAAASRLFNSVMHKDRGLLIKLQKTIDGAAVTKP